MSNFKTHGEAAAFCKKYGFQKPGNLDAFEIAEALLKAFKDGAHQQGVEAEAQNRAKCDHAFHQFTYWRCAKCGEEERSA